MITDSSLIPAYNPNTYCRSLILSLWHKPWNLQSTKKLREIKKNANPWFSSKTVLARLRIGHTRLIHACLFLGLFSPPSCQYCNEDHLTVQHLFYCPAFETTRLLHSVSTLLSAGLCNNSCLLYTSPSPRDRTRSRMPSSA